MHGQITRVFSVFRELFDCLGTPGRNRWAVMAMAFGPDHCVYLRSGVGVFSLCVTLTGSMPGSLVPLLSQWPLGSNSVSKEAKQKA